MPASECQRIFKRSQCYLVTAQMLPIIVDVQNPAVSHLEQTLRQQQQLVLRACIVVTLL